MIEFKNAAEYESAKRKHTANHEAGTKYCKENKTNGIPCEITKTFPFADEVTNELRSALEVWEFKNHIPESYFLYVRETEREAITWTGQKLGIITWLGPVFRSNFGDRRRKIDVLGINGKKYYGTYFTGAGNYARIRIIK